MLPWSPAIKFMSRSATVSECLSYINTPTCVRDVQVCFSILYGESSLASNNRLLGQFDIVNLPWAAAGEPQIEVTFSLSADLQLTVLARDLDSGRQKIWEQGGGAVLQMRCC